MEPPGANRFSTWGGGIPVSTGGDWAITLAIMSSVAPRAVGIVRTISSPGNHVPCPVSTSARGGSFLGRARSCAPPTTTAERAPQSYASRSLEGLLRLGRRRARCHGHLDPGNLQGNEPAGEGI